VSWPPRLTVAADTFCVALADRLRALDDQVVWVDAPKPKLTPGTALGLGLLAIGVYVGWSLWWGWPRALIAVLALTVALVAIARFWFSDPEGRPGVSSGGVGHDVDEVRHGRVETAT
jgi:hypothetical protein